MGDRKPRALDPDALPWERQPDETQAAYALFETYRDAEVRKVRDLGSAAQDWSVIWQWSYRVLEYDRWVAKKTAEEMVRYRVEMDARHRKTAREAQEKIEEWLSKVEVDKLKPSEAARWYELAVRVEREASGANLHEPVGAGGGAEVDNPLEGLDLGAAFGMDGKSDHEVADALFEMMLAEQRRTQQS